MSAASENLECPICSKPFDEQEQCPRVLNCGHTFCTCCLNELFKDGSVVCPQDRSENRLTEGVPSLAKNFALINVVRGTLGETNIEKVQFCQVCDDEHLAASICLECGQAMCDDTEKTHSKLRASKHHKLLPVEKIKSDPSISLCAPICTEHDQPYRFFDSTCKRVLCIECCVLDHGSHQCQTLPAAANNIEQKLKPICDEAKHMVEQIIMSQERVAGLISGLERHFKEAGTNLDATFEQVMLKLSSKKDELSNILRQEYKRKSAVLSDQKEGIETSLACLVNAIDQADSAIHCRGDVRLLLAYSDISKALEKYNGNSPDVWKGNEDVLAFFENHEAVKGLEKLIDDLGSVYLKFEAKDFMPDGIGLTYTFIGADNVFSIRPKRSNPIWKSVTVPLVVKVQTQDKNELPTKVEPVGDGSYRATYSGVADLSEKRVSIQLYGNEIGRFSVSHFFEKIVDLNVQGKFLCKPSLSGRISWARSVCLEGSGCLKFSIRLEVDSVNSNPRPEYPEHPAIRIFFQDYRNSNDPPLSEKDVIVAVNVHAKKSKMTSKKCLNCFVDFGGRRCGIEKQVGVWRDWFGFVKLNICFLHTGRFFVDCST